MNRIPKIEQKHPNLLNQSRMTRFTEYATKPNQTKGTPSFEEVLGKMRKSYLLDK